MSSYSIYVSLEATLYTGIAVVCVCMTAWAIEEYRMARGLKPTAFLLLAAAGIVGFMLALVGAASAHDPERPELNSWYMGLHSGKGPCCDGSDALSVADPDWESKDGHYRVRLNVSTAVSGVDMQWIDVPDEAVITEPNKSGRTLVWPISGYEGTTVRCFLPGSMT